MKKIIFVVLLALTLCAATVHAEEYVFSNDLKINSSGSDVTALQTWLIAQGYDIPAISTGAAGKGFFGSQTKAAVARYQLANQLPGTGYVGPLTRAKLNNRNTATTLKVISPNGGEVWEQGTYKTISWTNDGSGNSPVTISIQTQTPQCPPNTMCAAIPFVGYEIAKNLSTSNNSYQWLVGSRNVSSYCAECSAQTTQEGGEYIIKICKTGTSKCDISDKPFRIVPGATTTNVIKVTSPQNFVSWTAKSIQPITWTIDGTTNSTTKVDLYLEGRLVCPGGNAFPIPSPSPSSCNTAAYILDKNISSNVPYNWIVATDISDKDIPPESYRVKICIANTSICETSNSYFDITPATAATVSLVTPNGSERWYTNSMQAIKWKYSQTGKNSTDTVSIKITQYQPPCSPNHVCTLNAVSVETIATSVPAYLEQYNWSVGQLVGNRDLSLNQSYIVSICLESTKQCSYSAQPFSISYITYTP